MKWFVVFSMVIFLGVMFYLDILRYFIASSYWEGLSVVPIIMIAEFFFGVFFNLSLWYKLTDRTEWGMWFSLLGLAVTVSLNCLLVPVLGYMGSAWAAIACYAVMMVASYLVGRIKYPIGYQVGRLSGYFLFALALYGIAEWIAVSSALVNYAVRAALLVGYIFAVLKIEKMSLSSLLPIKKIHSRR